MIPVRVGFPCPTTIHMKDTLDLTWVKTTEILIWCGRNIYVLYTCDEMHLIQPIFPTGKDIEDIYFFEVNTKYISSSVLKTSEFS